MDRTEEKTIIRKKDYWKLIANRKRKEIHFPSVSCILNIIKDENRMLL